MVNNRKSEDARTQELRVEKQEHGTSGKKGSETGEQSISWISVISGWLAALGVALVLGGVLSGALKIGGSGKDVPRSETAWILLTLAVAFLVGGYVAGRMAGRRGLEHGILVALLSFALAVTLGLFGIAISIGLAETFDGTTLPKLPGARQSLEALLSPAGALVLVISSVGAAFGGIRGARTGHKNP